MMPGVYEIRNTIDGKLYVGSSLNCEARYTKHVWHLNRGTHDNAYLQNAWNAHGSKAFAFAVLETCTEDELLTREQVYLDRYYDKQVQCYNINPVAAKPPKCFGNKHAPKSHTEATKTRMSASHKARGTKPPVRVGKRDPAITAKIVATRKARAYKHSEAAKENMRLAALKRSRRV